jgi:myo-inositol-1(or 4)-monophosphatase
VNNLPSYHDDLMLIKVAATKAGQIAMRYFRNNPSVSLKKGLSPVSEADFAVNDFLHQFLRHERPDYGWLSEESADDLDRLTKQRTFVVDPIDGTRAFIDGQDVWCVSIAVVENGQTIAGVLECTARSEMFEAVHGFGSFLNGNRLKNTPPSSPLRISASKPWIDHCARILNTEIQHIKHIPSLAYRIAGIADNRYDGTLIKPNCKDWDISAATLILSEAGGDTRTHHNILPRYAGKIIHHDILAAGKHCIMPGILSVLEHIHQNNGV